MVGRSIFLTPILTRSANKHLALSLARKRRESEMGILRKSPSSRIKSSSKSKEMAVVLKNLSWGGGRDPASSLPHWQLNCSNSRKAAPKSQKGGRLESLPSTHTPPRSPTLKKSVSKASCWRERVMRKMCPTVWPAC